MIFLFLFLGNFNMGVQTYSHHCICTVAAKLLIVIRMSKVDY